MSYAVLSLQEGGASWPCLAGTKRTQTTTRTVIGTSAAISRGSSSGTCQLQHGDNCQNTMRCRGSHPVPGPLESAAAFISLAAQSPGRSTPSRKAGTPFCRAPLMPDAVPHDPAYTSQYFALKHVAICCGITVGRRSGQQRWQKWRQMVKK